MDRASVSKSMDSKGSFSPSHWTGIAIFADTVQVDLLARLDNGGHQRGALLSILGDEALGERRPLYESMNKKKTVKVSGNCLWSKTVAVESFCLVGLSFSLSL